MCQYPSTLFDLPRSSAMPPSARKDVSLQALELFEICARKGAMQAAADETGLSLSTVSHHLRNLEDSLGVALFDHARRPMVLTQKGQAFLRDIAGALHTIRKAKAEASAGGLSEASYLRIGSIEDFDSDIMPALAVHMARVMPKCDFLYHTDASHALLEMLRNRQLDLGITARSTEELVDLQDTPLLRDPFVVVTPKGVELPSHRVVAGHSDLPFLRFSSHLILARQIEAHLKRSGLLLPNRFECANTQTILAMVGAGAGWTITTPLLLSRARQFRSQLAVHPFPGKEFARTLSLVVTSDCAQSVREMVAQHMRQLIHEHALTPMHRDHALAGGPVPPGRRNAQRQRILNFARML